MNNIENKKDISNSLLIALLLSIAGGFLDSYSYLVRSETFATMQTGNMINCVLRLLNKELTGFMFLLPVLSFSIGIIIAILINHGLSKKNSCFKYISLIIEILSMVAAGFIPLGQFNFIVTMLIAFTSAIQIETFKDVEGMSFASTMCTGNLKSAMENIGNFIVNHQKENIIRCLKYILIIITFLFGITIGYVFVGLFNQYAILFTIIIYVVVLMILLIFNFKNKNKVLQNS